MNLTEAKLVLESLQELSPNEEDFSWGSTYTDAKQRQQQAIELMDKFITHLQYQKNRVEAGCGMLDSLEVCPECGGRLVVRMAGGSECKDCDHAEICY